jgi:hypothetical protein
MQRVFLLAATTLCSCGLIGQPNSAWAQPSAVQWIPADAPVVVDISAPLALLSPMLEPDLGKSLAAALTTVNADPKLQQLQGLVSFLELQLGTDWRTALRKLAGRQITFSVDASGGTLLSVDGQDGALLTRLHEIIREFAAGEAARRNQAGLVSSNSFRGVTTWTFGTNEHHALVGSQLLLANRPQTLERALDLHAASNHPGISRAPLYQAASRAVGSEAAAKIFLDLRTLRNLPGLKTALAEDGNPLTTLLLADTKSALREANWLALGIYVTNQEVVLRTFTDGAAPNGAKLAAFAIPPRTQDGALPALSPPGLVASMSLYRDLHSFYAAKDELFPERTSGLIFFENMMGIFFSGIDLTDGVLGETRPDVRVVVARQEYDPAVGVPAEQYPAFAAVLRLKHPEQFGLTMEEAWQKALGLANFTRGQKALPGLIIDRAERNGVKYTFSYYRPPAARSEPVDVRYNFRPSLARAGDYVIISSTDGLARDLIDAVQKEAAAPPGASSPANGVLELNGAALRASLEANRENLVRKNMVEKGHTREQAEAETFFFLLALGFLDHASLTLNRASGHPQAELRLKLQAPKNLAGSASGSRL